MKRFVLLLFAVFLLTGCSWGHTEMEQALSLRESLLSGNGCSFSTVITADYLDELYTFKMVCTSDKDGNLKFQVIKPDTISGISGEVSQSKGKLTFDDEVLLFETMAEGQITPISAPWLMLHTLRSGYIQGCAKQEKGLFIQIDDSYEDKALTVEYYLDNAGLPARVEILWEGRRVVSLDVENFTIL